MTAPGRSRITTHALNQTAVWWSGATNDGYGGRTFATMTEITVRWEDKPELFRNALGVEVTSQAVVYLDRDVTVGDYLMLGTVAVLASGADQPHDLPTSFAVKAFAKSPDLAAARFVRKAWL